VSSTISFSAVATWPLQTIGQLPISVRILLFHAICHVSTRPLEPSVFPVIGLPLMFHAFFLSLYTLALCGQQGRALFPKRLQLLCSLCVPVSLFLIFSVFVASTMLLTNERMNAWRYYYLKDEAGNFFNPFDEGPGWKGKLRNFLVFFKVIGVLENGVYSWS
jgi:hypothetical protein